MYGFSFFFNLPASCNFFPLLQLASAKHNFNNHCSWKCFPRMDLHKNGTNGSCPSSCGPLTEYYIPDYILKPDSEPVIIDNAPCCPVVVFINSRSGGQLGSSLIKTYRELLNEAQVNRLSISLERLCNTENLLYLALCHISSLNHVLIIGSTHFSVGF